MDSTLDRLAEMSEDDLYVEIGRQLYGMPAFPISREQLGEFGRYWTRQNLTKIVCDDEALRVIASKKASTRELILAVCAVLDVAAQALGGIPAITASALVVRAGLNKICESAWSSQADPDS